MSKCLVKLKPLDWYFFGGEKTFGDGEKAEYLAKSNLLPQQAAILGMLRCQLLKQKGWLVGDSNRNNAKTSDIEDLIGKSSFSIHSHTKSFGKISNISPICLYKESKFYFPMPLDDGYKVDFETCSHVYLNDYCSNSIVKVESFDHKSYNNYLNWCSSENDKVSCNDIFITKDQIGITKTVDKESDKNAFYKQEVCHLKDGFEFAFWVDIDGELLPDKIFLGAQRSCFAMKIKKDVEYSYYDKNPFSKGKDERIVLLSDTYVENINSLKGLCKFMWSYSVPFRNMETVANGKYKSGHISYNKQEICYNFLKAGSVLYFDEKNRSDIEALLTQDYLQNIGYNQFSNQKK